ncbi:MAG: type II secretion system F family protein, partial [Candidatus Saccharimonadales bacterium]
MPKFIYSATNSANEIITGSVEASDRAAVMAALSKQSLRPISIKEKRVNTSGGGSLLDTLMGSNKVKS